MSDLADDFRALRESRKKKRSHNRQQSRKLLDQWNIEYTVHNMGAHFIVEVPGTDGEQKVDFWPGTGKWIPRGSNKHGRGVKKLLTYLADASENENEPRGGGYDPQYYNQPSSSGGYYPDSGTATDNLGKPIDDPECKNPPW
jgi:hypothetical protein